MRFPAELRQHARTDAKSCVSENIPPILIVVISASKSTYINVNQGCWQTPSVIRQDKIQDKLATPDVANHVQECVGRGGHVYPSTTTLFFPFLDFPKIECGMTDDVLRR
jgi:hypothetical protein